MQARSSPDPGAFCRQLSTQSLVFVCSNHHPSSSCAGARRGTPRALGGQQRIAQRTLRTRCIRIPTDARAQHPPTTQPQEDWEKEDFTPKLPGVAAVAAPKAAEPTFDDEDAGEPEVKDFSIKPQVCVCGGICIVN